MDNVVFLPGVPKRSTAAPLQEDWRRDDGLNLMSLSIMLGVLARTLRLHHQVQVSNQVLMSANILEDLAKEMLPEMLKK